MSTKELVLLSDGRSEYNERHGTELETHTDALTSEQARRINDHYDIEIHVGTHGLPLGTQPDNPYALLQLPTQQEYQEAAAVVGGMQPGDTLLIEDYGFRTQFPESVDPALLSPARVLERGAANGMGVLGQLALTMVLRTMVDAMRSRLEGARLNYEISAWEYAQQLATLQGVRTVRADHDAFEEEALIRLSKGKSLMELTTSSSNDDRALADRMHAQRERAARNIVKDYALAHLPPEGAPVPTGRKPKLVLLFGGLHKEGLEQRFNDLGLDAKVTVMESTSEQDRVGEQVFRVMSTSMAATMSWIMDHMGGGSAEGNRE